MAALSDLQLMARALQLAAQGLYTTTPNPRVGCVIAREGAVVAEGFHRAAGLPHAERNALAQLNDAASGCTVYVTLEPCSHTGRTGPCADALIAAGVSRVVVAMEDPNPQVAGAGIRRLREAGISVDVGLLEDAARELNAGYIKRMTQQLPWVRVKLAMSLDGRTALASGESKWITGAAARQEVQELRARSCAVITGAGTVVDDNPSLLVRPAQWRPDDSLASVRQPLRVLLDASARVAPDCQLLSDGAQTLWLTRQPQEVSGAVENVALDTRDLQAVLHLLADRGCNEVLVEAGSTLAGAFMQSGLVDELVVFMAPVLLGHEGRPLMLLDSIHQMADRVELLVLDARKVGDDLCLTFGRKPAALCGRE